MSIKKQEVISEKFSPQRTMPAYFVMIRHGESQANLVQKAFKAGVLPKYPPELAQIPDREIRLSKKGEKQADETGNWLKQKYEHFDAFYVSDHVRAMQTAGILCRGAGYLDAEFRIDHLLSERSWGHFADLLPEEQRKILVNKIRDPLFLQIPGDESMSDARERSRHLLTRLARLHQKQKVIVVTHGEFIESTWAEIRHMSTESQREFFHSSAGNIKNCQVIEFSSIDPTNNQYTGRLGWVRSSCPSLNEVGEWHLLDRVKYNIARLLKEADSYKNLNIDEEALAEAIKVTN